MGILVLRGKVHEAVLERCRILAANVVHKTLVLVIFRVLSPNTNHRCLTGENRSPAEPHTSSQAASFERTYVPDPCFSKCVFAIRKKRDGVIFVLHDRDATRRGIFVTKETFHPINDEEASVYHHEKGKTYSVLWVRNTSENTTKHSNLYSCTGTSHL